MARTQYSKTCLTCGVQFETPNKTQQFHSLKCRRPHGGRVKRPLLDRFLEHVRRLSNGCLECDLTTTGNGYPTIHVDGMGMKLVSHVAWFLHYGWWPPPKTPLDHVCHIPGLCEGGVDDPHRRCAEWSHLKMSSPQENGGPKRSNAGRINREKTVCINGHELTPENTGRDSRGDRYCKACSRAHKATWYRKMASGKPSKPPKTTCKHGHEMTKENTFTNKDGIKCCRECARTRGREFARRKRAQARLQSTTAAVLITSPPV